MRKLLSVKDDSLVVWLGVNYISFITYDELLDKEKVTRISFGNFDCFSTTLNDWKRTRETQEIEFIEIPGVGVKVTLISEGKPEISEVYILRKTNENTSLIIDYEELHLTDGFLEEAKK